MSRRLLSLQAARLRANKVRGESASTTTTTTTLHYSAVSEHGYGPPAPSPVPRVVGQGRWSEAGRELEALEKLVGGR